MNALFKRILNGFRSLNEEEKQLQQAVQTITRKPPLNLEIYKLAMIHASAGTVTPAGVKECNERLEYLGDAILGAVVADFLFKQYPTQDEGFLTEIRSRIVSRESLGQLARKLGIDRLVVFDEGRRGARAFKSMHGDAMEAFVGAVYLDRGYAFCKKFIIKEILTTHLDLDEVIATNTNYKSQLIEWAQKNNQALSIDIVNEKGRNHQKQFTAQVILEGRPVAEGSGYSKKKAEQDAARKACNALDIEE